MPGDGCKPAAPVARAARSAHPRLSRRRLRGPAPRLSRPGRLRAPDDGRRRRAAPGAGPGSSRLEAALRGRAGGASPPVVIARFGAARLDRTAQRALDGLAAAVDSARTEGNRLHGQGRAAGSHRAKSPVPSGAPPDVGAAPPPPDSALTRTQLRPARGMKRLDN